MTSGRVSCPYVGLQPFTEEDRDYFFGRQREQRVVISNLLATPLTVFYGASGVGKSSVLMAGVVPLLRRERPKTPVVVFRDWRAQGMRQRLTEACLAAMAAAGAPTPPTAEQLEFDQLIGSCAEAARTTLLVIFDQFEEFFLYHPKSDASDSFEAGLARAINREDVDCGILVSLREDGLARLDRFRTRIPNLLANTLRILHLDDAGAEAAVREPLRIWNERIMVPERPIHIEEDLVSAVISQVHIGQVVIGRRGGSGLDEATESRIEAPFLQLVLTRLWEAERAEGSDTLRLATLTRLGGAQSIVRQHLDGVMEALDDGGRHVCASFFDRLVTPSGGKIACREDDLARWAEPHSARVPAVLETLASNRVLRSVAMPDQPDQNAYEVFHDVLAPAILDWQLRFTMGKEREEAERRAREEEERRQAAFLSAEQARSNRRLRWLVAALSLMVVVAISATIIAVKHYRRAKALAEASSLANESIARFHIDPELSLALALHAVDRTYRLNATATPDAEDALRQSLQLLHLGKTLSGHEGQVRAVGFSPNGKLLATGSWDGTVRLWNGETGEALQVLSHGTRVSDLTFLPGEKRLITTSYDRQNGQGMVRFWDLALSDAPIWESPMPSVVEAVTVSPDGRWVATAERDRTVKVWDTDTNLLHMSPFGRPGDWVVGLAFSPDSAYLAMASVDPTVTRIWHVETMTEVVCIGGAANNAVLFTPDGTGLILAGRDDAIRVMRPANARLDETLGGRIEALQYGVRPYAAYDEGEHAPRGCADEATVEWSTRTLADHVEQVRSIAVSADGARIASGAADGSAKIWDGEEGALLFTLRGHRSWVESMAFSPDGERLATASRDGSIRLWRVGRHTGAIYGIAFSPDGSLLATAGGDKTAKIWSLASGEPVLRHTLKGHDSKVFKVAFSPRGDLVATAAFDRTAKLWNVETGREARTLRGHKGELRDVAFARDGKRLATAVADGSVFVWPVDGEGEPLIIRHDDNQQVHALAFAPRGSGLATVGWDGRLRLWDPVTGEAIASLVDKGERLNDLVFSPDGREIVTISTSGKVKIWPLESGESGKSQEPRLMANLGEYCTGIAYSPDSLAIVASCADGTVRLWDRPGESRRGAISVHTEPINDVAISADGRFLATASSDKTFHVSPIDVGGLIAFSRTRMSRRLTPDECARFLGASTCPSP
jgi:WD40 repeat protein